MHRPPSPLRVALALNLVLFSSCSAPRKLASDDGVPRVQPRVIGAQHRPEGEVRLCFGPTPANPDLEALTAEEARIVLKAFHQTLGQQVPKE